MVMMMILLETGKQSQKALVLVDSIGSNKNYTCDFFYSGVSIIFSGTWDKIYKSQLGYYVDINIINKEWAYKYDFFDNYKTHRFRLEDNNVYI